MGYESTVDGELSFTRKTSAKKPSKAFLKEASDLGIPLEEGQFEGAGGLTHKALNDVANTDFIRNYGNGVPTSAYVEIYASERKAYNILEELQEVVHLAARDGVVVNGRVVRLGEEQPDVELFEVEDNIITTHPGKIVFDNGYVYGE